MKWLIIVTSLLVGCSSDNGELAIKSFKEGKQLKCGGSITTYPVVVSNESWKYSPNLKAFYQDNGDYYNAEECSI